MGDSYVSSDDEITAEEEESKYTKWCYSINCADVEHLTAKSIRIGIHVPKCGELYFENNHTSCNRITKKELQYGEGPVYTQIRWLLSADLIVNQSKISAASYKYIYQGILRQYEKRFITNISQYLTNEYSTMPANVFSAAVYEFLKKNVCVTNILLRQSSIKPSETTQKKYMSELCHDQIIYHAVIYHLAGNTRRAAPYFKHLINKYAVEIQNPVRDSLDRQLYRKYITDIKILLENNLQLTPYTMSCLKKNYSNSPMCIYCQYQGCRKKCKGCQSVWYCNKSEQKRDWPRHKKTCGKYAKENKWLRIHAEYGDRQFLY